MSTRSIKSAAEQKHPPYALNFSEQVALAPMDYRARQDRLRRVIIEATAWLAAAAIFVAIGGAIHSILR